MDINNNKVNKDLQRLALSQHVKIDMGKTYCIISCSKHRLSDMVNTVDAMQEKHWQVVPGLTSDDGLVFQAMSKLQTISKNTNNKKKGV